MAEFQEVLHQWRRLCDKYHSCDKCPGGKTSDKESICMLMSYDNRRTEAEVEDIIMSWAAENPEPVYPTWFEVLENMGIAGRINGEPYYDSLDREVYLKVPAFTPKAFYPIPADIAEKLGIEPKEG